MLANFPADYGWQVTLLIIGAIFSLPPSILAGWIVYRIENKSRREPKLPDVQQGRTRKPTEKYSRRPKTQSAFSRWLLTFPRWLRIALTSLAVMIVVAVPTTIIASSWVFPTQYFSAITERYGVAVGIGEPLNDKGREMLPYYWEIKNNMLTKTVHLKFKTPGTTPELLRQNSTLFSSDVFRNPSWITCHYKKSDGAVYAVKAQYRDSSGKRLLDLQYEHSAELLRVKAYDGSIYMQLFQSFLFRVDSSSYQSLLPTSEYHITYDGNGFAIQRVTVVEDEKTKRSALRNSNEIYGETLSYCTDKQSVQFGQLNSVSFLDSRGTPVANNLGLFGLRISRETNGATEIIQTHWYEDEALAQPSTTRASLQWVYENGKLISRVSLDTEGKERKDGIHYNFFYNEKAQLVKESYLDSEGNAYTLSSGASKREYDYRDLAFRVTMRTIANETEAIHTFASSLNDGIDQGENYGSRTTEYLFSSGKKPRLKEIRYLTIEGASMPGEDGYSSKKMRYNAQGYLIKESYYGTEGKPFIIKKDGYSAIAYEYNIENGECIKKSYLDEKGKLVVCRSMGWAYDNTKFSTKNGLPVVTRTRFGMNKKATSNADGYHKSIEYYDSNGRIIESRWYDENDAPILDNQGVHAYHYKYTVRDLTQEISCYDCDSQRTVSSSTGYAYVQYERDENGRTIKESYYDAKDKPTAKKGNTHSSVEWDYDEQGNCVEVRNFGPDGNLVISKENGYAVLKQRWENGVLCEKEYFGINNEPIICASNGAFRIVYSGNTTEYFDMNEQLAPGKDGYAKMIKTERQAGNGKTIEFRYYDADGNPALHKSYGCAIMIEHYNANGNFVGCEYLDSERNPVIDKRYRRASFTKTVDAKGNDQKVIFFGVDGEPNLCESGYAIAEYNYDIYGNVTERRFYDTDGKALIYSTEFGAAKVTYSYNRYGDTIETSYFGENDEPILGKGGFASCSRKYDLRGNCVEERYYGDDGKLTLSDNGIAIYKGAYDDRGRWLGASYFDINEKPVIRKDNECAQVKNEYDALGHQTVSSTFGTDGKLLDVNGYATVRWGHDAFGNVISWSYFDAKGNPVLKEDTGYHRYAQIFNAWGKTIEETTFDPNDKPFAPEEKTYARLANDYDVFGRITGTAYYDANEKPALCAKDGYHKAVYKYDERSNRTETSYYDIDGKPMLYGGKAVERVEYDAQGNVISRQFFGLIDELVYSNIMEYDSARGLKTLDTWGYTSGSTNESQYTYQTNGTQTTKTEKTFVDGELTSITETVTNEYGDVLSASFFDGKGKPLEDAVTRYTYNGFGLQTLEESFGADGKLRMTSDGEFEYARLKTAYSRFGKMETTNAFDTAGKPVMQISFGNNGEQDGTCKFWYDGDKFDTIIYKDWHPVGDIVYHPNKNLLYTYTADEDGKGKGTAVLDGRIIYEGEFEDLQISGNGKATIEISDKVLAKLPKTLQTAKPYVITLEGEWRFDTYYAENYSFSLDLTEDDIQSELLDYLESYEYLGSWKDGKWDGEGIKLYDSGYYKGAFQANERNGKGITYRSDGTKWFEGDYKNGQWEGKGTYYWEDGSKYVGEWKVSERSGEGTYYYADGRKYVGEWKADKPNGKGVYYYADGSIEYKGEIKDWNYHGAGTFSSKDGKLWTGSWKNGEWVN